MPGAGQFGEVESPSYGLAVRLLAGGRVDEATALLEDLHAADPSALAVYLKLSEAYEAARRYEDLVRLVESRVAAEPSSLPRRTELGTAYHRAGRADDARRAWAEAVDTAPDDEQTYRLVATEIGQLRLYGEAVAILERGRERLNDDRAFRLERANLYVLMAEHAQAAKLYLGLLAENEEYLPAVRAQFTRMLSSAGAPEALDAALTRATALDPLSRSLRELQSWLALERGDYDAALDAVRALDRLARENGESLLAFAEQASGAGAQDAARRALDEILERHADSPVAPAALLAQAQLLDDQARRLRESAPTTPTADAARDAYVAFLDAHGATEAAPVAAYRLALLLRDIHRDYDAAETRFNEAASGRNAGVAAQARLALGETAVRRGDLDAARARFQDVDETIRIGPLAEQARYDLALIDFYEGLMFSALARAEALDENTAAEAANDAIALRVTLTDALDPDASLDLDADRSGEPLWVFARAALAHRRDLHTDALATLDSLDTLPEAGTIGDASLYLRARALADLGRAADAIDALNRLIAEHPMSFYVDRALRLQAQKFEHDLSDPAAAADAYDRLLDGFPGSPLAAEARAELRRLRALLGPS